MGHWIGVDYGTRRIGLAISDVRGRIAAPADTLVASGMPRDDAPAILRWAAPHEPTGFVVGLPLNMNGSSGTQAALSKELARCLRSGGDCVVELWDERLTSFQANQLLSDAGVKHSERRRRRDAVAAQVILQSFLDARRNRRAPPKDHPGNPGR